MADPHPSQRPDFFQPLRIYDIPALPVIKGAGEHETLMGRLAKALPERIGEHPAPFWIALALSQALSPIWRAETAERQRRWDRERELWERHIQELRGSRERMKEELHPCLVRIDAAISELEAGLFLAPSFERPRRQAGYQGGNAMAAGLFLITAKTILEAHLPEADPDKPTTALIRQWREIPDLDDLYRGNLKVAMHRQRQRMVAFMADPSGKGAPPAIKALCGPSTLGREPYRSRLLQA